MKNELVNRRNAVSTLLFGGAASLAGCMADPDKQFDTSETANGAALTLADAAVIYADPPSTAATEALRATANRNMLQQFFNDVETTRRIGIIPPGDYVIDATLDLPRRGRVVGCGEANTAIVSASAANFTLLRVKPGTAFLELGHLELRGPPTPGNLSIGVFIDHTPVAPETAGVIELNFHDLYIYQVYGGILCQGTTSLAAGHFSRILFRVAGYSMTLRNTVACRLLYLTSDHVQLAQDTNAIADFLIEGISGAGGGVWLDYVVSQYPSQNGILIQNFLGIWGRHLSGDGALGRGIWIRNCNYVHLIYPHGVSCGRPGAADQNTWGYGIVVENDSLPSAGSQQNPLFRHSGGSRIAGRGRGLRSGRAPRRGSSESSGSRTHAS